MEKEDKKEIKWKKQPPNLNNLSDLLEQTQFVLELMKKQYKEKRDALCRMK